MHYGTHYDSRMHYGMHYDTRYDKHHAKHMPSDRRHATRIDWSAQEWDLVNDTSNTLEDIPDCVCDIAHDFRRCGCDIPDNTAYITDCMTSSLRKIIEPSRYLWR
jgi:hypothetical protein